MEALGGDIDGDTLKTEHMATTMQDSDDNHRQLHMFTLCLCVFRSVKSCESFYLRNPAGLLAEGTSTPPRQYFHFNQTCCLFTCQMSF